MREWICVALAATSLACSGGSDSVHTVGGINEDGRLSGVGPYNPFGDNGIPTTSRSTLAVLCTKACAHLRAKDCEASPANTVDLCEGECKEGTEDVPTKCVDEAAALYACTIEATVACTGNFMDEPTAVGCDSEASELQKCETPGADCAVASLNEEQCLSLGFSNFVVCSEGIEPSPSCLPIALNAFCCP